MLTIGAPCVGHISYERPLSLFDNRKIHAHWDTISLYQLCVYLTHI